MLLFIVYYCLNANHLMANISTIESKYAYSSLTILQDSSIGNHNIDTSNIVQSPIFFKSPGKAMLFSAIIPGMGQSYMGRWKRGLIFLLIDGLAIGTLFNNNDLSETKKWEYTSYAEDHWDFSRWIHDYYKWYPSTTPSWYLGSDSSWNTLREVFVNKSDPGCDEPPYCYTDIWEHSHSITYSWNGETYSSSPSNPETFYEHFNELCGDNSSHIEKDCDNNINEIEAVMVSNSVYVNKDHHFYEGIQKYDMFFAGWDDNDSSKVIDRGNNDKNVSSPNQSRYRSIWSDYNRIKTLASHGGKFMLINRFVSMLDALLLVKKWNNEHDIHFSFSTYPDLRNKSGVGEIRLSIFWE